MTQVSTIGWKKLAGLSALALLGVSVVSLSTAASAMAQPFGAANHGLSANVGPTSAGSLDLIGDIPVIINCGGARKPCHRFGPYVIC
jgi:hypothetical protein